MIFATLLDFLSFQTMGMGIGVGEGEGEGLRPEFTPYYRTPRKEAMQLKGENDDSYAIER